MKQFKFLLLFLIITGCNDGFYKDHGIEDLWRLPLIKPYELRNVKGAKRNDSNNDNWHLVFKHNKDTVLLEDGDVHEYYLGVNVTMVNVENGIIYGYGTANPGQSFIINTKTEEERTFEIKEEWQNELIKLNLDFNKLYDVFDLFDDFTEHQKLKWGSLN